MLHAGCKACSAVSQSVEPHLRACRVHTFTTSDQVGALLGAPSRLPLQLPQRDSRLRASYVAAQADTSFLRCNSATSGQSRTTARARALHPGVLYGLIMLLCWLFFKSSADTCPSPCGSAQQISSQHPPFSSILASAPAVSGPQPTEDLCAHAPHKSCLPPHHLGRHNFDPANAPTCLANCLSCFVSWWPMQQTWADPAS